jgi:hypothetical protein
MLESTSGPLVTVYFCMFVFIGSIVLLNLFIAVIMDVYDLDAALAAQGDPPTSSPADMTTETNPLKNPATESESLNVEAPNYGETTLSGVVFQSFITFCILLNCVILAMDEYPRNPER